MSFEREIRIPIPDDATEEDIDAIEKRVADQVEKDVGDALDNALKNIRFD